jgi:hypothetical protein
LLGNRNQVLKTITIGITAVAIQVPSRRSLVLYAKAGQNGGRGLIARCSHLRASFTAIAMYFRVYQLLYRAQVGLRGDEVAISICMQY